LVQLSPFHPGQRWECDTKNQLLLGEAAAISSKMARGCGTQKSIVDSVQLLPFRLGQWLECDTKNQFSLGAAVTIPSRTACGCNTLSFLFAKYPTPSIHPSVIPTKFHLSTHIRSLFYIVEPHLLHPSIHPIQVNHSTFTPSPLPQLHHRGARPQHPI